MAGYRQLKGAGQASWKREISFSPSSMTVYNWGPQVSLYNTDLSLETWPCLPPGLLAFNWFLGARTEHIQVCTHHAPARTPAPLSKMAPLPTHLIRNLGTTLDSSGLHPCAWAIATSC